MQTGSVQLLFFNTVSGLPYTEHESNPLRWLAVPTAVHTLFFS